MCCVLIKDRQKCFIQSDHASLEDCLAGNLDVCDFTSKEDYVTFIEKKFKLKTTTTIRKPGFTESKESKRLRKNDKNRKRTTARERKRERERERESEKEN